MTYIAEAAVSGNHAAMGKSPPVTSGCLFESSLTIWDILRAGGRRGARHEEMAAAESMPDSKAGHSGATGIHARSLVLRGH